MPVDTTTLVANSVEAVHHHVSMNELIREHGFLAEDDYTGISFWIISIAMVATTVFLMMESQRISSHHKTSVHCGALVTLVAGVHYFYMREFWVQIQETPMVYRYIDWAITVPLQMVEFYLVLDGAAKATLSQRPPSAMFWRLLIGTVIMLAFGYAGETKMVDPMVGFCCGMAGWAFILFEVYAGQANTFKKSFAEGGDEAVASAFDNMKFIVTFGWSIYPLGYYFGYLNTDVSTQSLNVIYNVADFINKIAFVLSVWAACPEAGPYKPIPN